MICFFKLVSSNSSVTNLFLILQNYLRPFEPLSQSECRDNKNAATFWRRRALIQWECRISRHNKYHMQQKQLECKVSRYRQLLNQSASGISRHNKNHMLPKRDTMLTSISCFKNCSGDISPFCGATDTPILDFWWRLLWVSKKEWAARPYPFWYLT